MGSIRIFNVRGVQPFLARFIVVSVIQSISYIMIDLVAIDVIEISVSSELVKIPISKLLIKNKNYPEIVAYSS